jgi:hypothetical protein
VALGKELAALLVVVVADFLVLRCRQHRAYLVCARKDVQIRVVAGISPKRVPFVEETDHLAVECKQLLDERAAVVVT